MHSLIVADSKETMVTIVLEKRKQGNSSAMVYYAMLLSVAIMPVPVFVDLLVITKTKMHDLRKVDTSVVFVEPIHKKT